MIYPYLWDITHKYKSRQETQIKFYKTVALTVYLYGCEAFVLKEDFRKIITHSRNKILESRALIETV